MATEVKQPSSGSGHRISTSKLDANTYHVIISELSGQLRLSERERLPPLFQILHTIVQPRPRISEAFPFHAQAGVKVTCMPSFVADSI
jgi:hypothetical protein